MEQVNSNAILDLVYQIAQQTMASAPAPAESQRSEPSAFQKELEQRSRAAKEEPKETTVAEKPTQKDAGPAEPRESDEELALENAQNVVQQLVAAGIVKIVPADETVVAQQPVVEADGEDGLTISLIGENAAQQPEAAAPVQTGSMPEQVQFQAQAQVQTAAPAAQPEGEVLPQEGQAETVQTVEQPQAQTQGEAQSESRPDAPAPQTEAPPEVKKDEVEVTDAVDGGEPLFQEVKELPIKVGEAVTTQESESAEAEPVSDQIGGKLAQALQNGESKVTIQLSPESLGRVEVELTWSPEGALRVSLNAESSQTRALLAQDSSSLMAALSRHTGEDVQVLVTVQEQEEPRQDLHDGRGGDQQQQEQQEQQQGHRQRSDNTQDFLQQLRLGLIPVDGEAS